jgi:hypothetical protein
MLCNYYGSKMTQVELKHFTVKEARRTLPLVRQIVRDILNNAYEIRTIAESLNGLIEENVEIERLADQISSFMGELEEIGCTYKDWNFQIGLVDFPSFIDDEEVFLCWRSDEENIQFYHGINEGFAGRKLIPEIYL